MSRNRGTEVKMSTWDKANCCAKHQTLLVLSHYQWELTKTDMTKSFLSFILVQQVTGSKN